MLFARSAPALRSLSLRIGPRRVAVRSLSRSAPCSNSSGQFHHPTGGSSDLPWIIGSVGITIPTCFYLMTSRSKPSQTDPHKPMDTVSTSTGRGVQTTQVNKPGVQLPQEKAEAAVVEEKEKEEKEVEVPEATAEDAASVSSDATAAINETTHGQDSEEVEAKPTSVNPQLVDPGDTGMKPAGSMNVTSGKQQGLSNDDTWHAILHEARGDYLSKKGEGIHETSKIKGTVDVNRPAK